MNRDDYIRDAIKASRDMPNGHNREGFAAGPVGVHRDSDSLAKSNYRIALQAMIEAAGIEDPLEVQHMPISGPICANCDHPETRHHNDGCHGADIHPALDPYRAKTKCPCPQLETVDLYIGAFGHWAVGWIEEILWRADNERLADTAFELAEQLDDYPVLDEMDYSEQEWSDNHPGDGNCYVDPRDIGEPCPCGLMSVYCSGERDYTEPDGREYVTHDGPCVVHGDQPQDPIYLTDPETDTDNER